MGRVVYYNTEERNMKRLLVILFLALTGCADPMLMLQDNIVKVEVSPDDGGTGFFVNSHGRTGIITNAHVCDKNKTVLVSYYTQKAKIPVYYKDIGVDLCYIKAQPRPNALLLSHMKTVPHYTPAFMNGYAKLVFTNLQAGYALDISNVPVNYQADRDGKCKDKARPKNVYTPFGIVRICTMRFKTQNTTFSIFPGNSGSPVVDKDGRVIGVMQLTDGETGYGLMITIDTIREFLNTVNAIILEEVKDEEEQ